MTEINKFLRNIKPREYQQKIFETCKKKNCLVILPTGIGKTLIALMLSIERMCRFPGKKVLFLAPTRPLAQQHFIYFQEHLPELFGEVQLFTGKIPAKQRKETWQSADIIFSTPQCISNDLKNQLYTLEPVCLLIEDEAHRCIKNYSYKYVAQEYLRQTPKELQRILGLTASPGSETKKIQEICKNLQIEEVEIRARESKDVKPYLQEIKFEIIRLEFPKEFERIRKILRELHGGYIEELKKRNLLHEIPTKSNLIGLQNKIMLSISRGNRHFNLLRGASACAQAIKLQHAMELLETQTIESFQKYLQTLFKEAKNKKSKGVQQLVKKPEFNMIYSQTLELSSRKIEHPKLKKVSELIASEIRKNKNSKTIIFAQYRDTVAKVCRELNSIPGIHAKVFVGQAKKEGTGLSQKEQQSIIHEFSVGKINALCATSIGEEGLDIPEVNAVIFYEPVPSAIRKIQRAGRTARVMPGKLIILITKKTRDEGYHWAAFHKEKRMHSIIKDLKQKIKDNTPKSKPQKSLSEFNS